MIWMGSGKYVTMNREELYDCFGEDRQVAMHKARTSGAPGMTYVAEKEIDIKDAQCMVDDF
eukprot:Clim_evm71s25 gene=Clim_evmTU71s25